MGEYSVCVCTQTWCSLACFFCVCYALLVWARPGRGWWSEKKTLRVFCVSVCDWSPWSTCMRFEARKHATFVHKSFPKKFKRCLHHHHTIRLSTLPFWGFIFPEKLTKQKRSLKEMLFQKESSSKSGYMLRIETTIYLEIHLESYSFPWGHHMFPIFCGKKATLYSHCIYTEWPRLAQNQLFTVAAIRI